MEKQKMVTKSKKASTGEKKRRVKVGNLHLNKETVKDLTGGEQKKVEGGARIGVNYDTEYCLTYQNPYCISSHTACICG